MAVVALLASAAPGVSTAQSSNDLAGVWTFQTELYGTMQVGAYMSGVAVLTAEGRNRYDIRLLANERLVNRLTGENRLLTARQNCSGVQDGGQFTINCELAEPLEGYQPDSFVLQQGEADQLVGVLSSNASSQVTFSRLR